MADRAVPSTLLAVAVAAALGGCGDAGRDVAGGDPPPRPTVTVYTDRYDPPLTAVLQAFHDRTGVRPAVVVASTARLLERLARERAEGGVRADLVVVDDAAALADPVREGLLAPVETRTLERAAGDGPRHPEGRWWGVTQRTWVLATRCGEDVEPPASLDALADSTWSGRVLVGDVGPTTPRSLVAAVVARRGPLEAAAWADSLAGGLARPPRGDDAAQVEALLAGEGDVAVVDSRVLARTVDEETPGRVCVRIPDGDRGAALTVSAAGVVEGSRRRSRAVALLEHLLGAPSQRTFAWEGHEYPVRDDVPWSPTLLAWGGFRADTTGPATLRAAADTAGAILRRAAPPGEEGVSPGAARGAAAVPAPRVRRPPRGRARPRRG